MLHYTAFGNVKKINNKIISKRYTTRPRIIEGMTDTSVDNTNYEIIDLSSLKFENSPKEGDTEPVTRDTNGKLVGLPDLKFKFYGENDIIKPSNEKLLNVGGSTDNSQGFKVRRFYFKKDNTWTDIDASGLQNGSDYRNKNYTIWKFWMTSWTDLNSPLKLSLQYIRNESGTPVIINSNVYYSGGLDLGSDGNLVATGSWSYTDPTTATATATATDTNTTTTNSTAKKDVQRKLSDENKSLDIKGNLNITGVLRATQYANFPKDNRLEKLKISNTSTESDDNVMLEIGDDISGNLRFGLNNGYSQFESINLGGAEPQFKFVTAKTKNDNSYEYSEVATINENKLILPKSLCLGETCINEEQLKKILGENS